MQPVVVDAVCEAIDAVEAAARAVDDGVADRDMAASADQALRAARFDLAECLRRLGRGEEESGPPACGGVR
jgi:hypothetical protein